MLEVFLTEEEMLAMSLKESMATILEDQATREDSDSFEDFLDIFKSFIVLVSFTPCIVECLTFWSLFVLFEKQLGTR